MLSYTVIFYARIEISRWGVLSDFVCICIERESIGEWRRQYFISILPHENIYVF